MAQLSFLGASWTETDGEFQLQPGHSVPLLPSTRVRLLRDVSQQTWLDALINAQWGNGYRVNLHVQAPCILDQQEWRLTGLDKSAVHQFQVISKTCGEDTFWLETGAFSLHASQPWLRVHQQDIALYLSADSNVLISPDRFEHPITVVSKDLECRIDLTKAQLTYSSGSFLAKLSCFCQAYATGYRSLNDQTFLSAEHKVDLSQNQSTSELEFETESRIFLNFELDSRQHCVGYRFKDVLSEQVHQNSAVPSFEAVDYKLNIIFKRAETQSLKGPPIVAGMSFVSKHPSSHLICNGAIDEHDRSSILVSDRIDLLVRLGNPSIYDNLNVASCMVSFASLSTATISSELHGFTPGTWIRLLGADRLTLATQRHTDPGLVASLLRRDPDSLPHVSQIESHLACYDALTVLERVAASEESVQAESEIGLKILTSSIGDVEVEPLRFTGGTLLVPLVDVDRLRDWNWVLRSDELFSLSFAEFDTIRHKLEKSEFPDLMRGHFHQASVALGNDLRVKQRSEGLAWTLSDASQRQEFLAFGSSDGLHVCKAAENPLRDLLEKLNIKQGDASGPRAVASTKTHVSRLEVGPGSQASRTLSEIVTRESPGFKSGHVSREKAEAGKLSESELRQVFDDHTAVLNFDNVEFALPVLRDGLPDNPVPDLQGMIKKANFHEFIPHRFADGISSWFRIPFDIPEVEKGDGLNYVVGLQQTLAILKLQSGVGLQEIVENLPKGERGPRWYVKHLVEGGRDQFGAMQPGNQIDGDVLSPGWTGAIIFSPGMLFDVPGLDSLLSKFIALPMRYLAFSAHIDGDTIPRDYANIYGTYRYVDEGAGESGLEESPDTDVIWDLGAVDVRFRDREITHFEITGFLLIRKFWKTEVTEDTEPHIFKVVGRYQSASAEGNPTREPRIVFEATSKTPLEMKINGDDGLAFLKAVYFKGVTVYLEGIGTSGSGQQNSRFELDGEIETQKWKDGPEFLQVDPDKKIKFSHLGLPLPGNGRMKWDWPSLEFPLKQKQPLRLGSIEFTFTGIGIGKAELFQSMLKVFGDEPAGTFPWVSLKVELFKYPQLSEKAGQSLGFELVTAIQDDGSAGGLWLKGLDFDNLDIDLFRFLRIRARKIKLFGEQGQTALLIYQMSLEILGKEIIGSKEDEKSGLTALMFQDTNNSEQRGFVAYIHEKIEIHPVVVIDWLLLANGVYLGKLAPLLLSLEEADSDDLLETIQEQAKERKLGGAAVKGRWGFGIGFAILGESSSLRAKMLFMDGSVYGLMLQSEILEQWLGFEGFAIAYIKGDTPERDHFWLEIQVPWFTAGAFNFLGGVIAFEVYLKGGFMTDFGYPWLKDGIRRWDRGLGFNVGIYVGHAGAYFRYLPGKSANGGTEITVAGGFGLAIGYGWGGEFAGGRLKVYVGIEVYGIVEGDITIEAGSGLKLLGNSGSTVLTAPITSMTVASRGLTLTRARLTGIVGIVVRGYGELDVWILYAKIEVIAFAEAETTLLWAKNQRAQLIYAFRIGQRFEGSCRVGKGWFSWTFRVTVEATMEIGGAIDL